MLTEARNDLLEKEEMLLRAINWKSDCEALSELDSGFVTDQVYAVRRDGLSCSFVEEARVPAVAKRYDCTLTEERISGSLIAIAACEKKEIRGYEVLCMDRIRPCHVAGGCQAGKARHGTAPGFQIHIGRTIQTPARYYKPFGTRTVLALNHRRVLSKGFEESRSYRGRSKPRHIFAGERGAVRVLL